MANSSDFRNGILYCRAELHFHSKQGLIFHLVSEDCVASDKNNKDTTLMGWTIFMVATAINKRPAFVHINFFANTMCGDQAIFQKGSSLFYSALSKTFTTCPDICYTFRYYLTSSLERIKVVHNSCMLTISIVGSKEYIQFVGLIPQESRSLLCFQETFPTIHYMCRNYLHGKDGKPESQKSFIPLEESILKPDN